MQANLHTLLSLLVTMPSIIAIGLTAEAMANGTLMRTIDVAKTIIRKVPTTLSLHKRVTTKATLMATKMALAQLASCASGHPAWASV